MTTSGWNPAASASAAAIVDEDAEGKPVSALLTQAPIAVRV